MILPASLVLRNVVPSEAPKAEDPAIQPNSVSVSRRTDSISVATVASEASCCWLVKTRSKVSVIF